MFRVIFAENHGRVFHLKVCGIRSQNRTIVWGAPIEYKPAKGFVDRLNADHVCEEELMEAAMEFLLRNSELCS